jgi:ATP adenylyltransferase
VKFQLRYCPRLAKKPLPNKDQGSLPKKKINPFENPEPGLFVTDIPPNSPDPSHFLVLNKFPIIPSHFILATKTNKAQSAVLEAEDLTVAYECLRAWEDGHQGRRLYGFFNSGEHSGASQAHRHLQFVPVEAMRQDDEKGEWDMLIDKIVDDNAKMPFEVFWERISPSTSKEQLYSIYDKLYMQAHEALKRFISQRPGELELHSTKDGSSPFSYNLGMTTKALMLVPRRREGIVLRRPNGEEVGFAAFNGTVLAGTMMVKKLEEWNLLKGNNVLLDELLKGIGIPKVES